MPGAGAKRGRLSFCPGFGYIAGVLRIREQAWRAMIGHARAAAPEEACGILAGRRSGSQREVLRAVPCRNVHAGDRRRHFLIDPEEQIAAQREAREGGLEILGFYHSHHTGSAAMSDEDCRQAHPHVSNLILAFRAGSFAEARSWRVRGGVAAEEEPLCIDGVTAPPGSASEKPDAG